MFGPGHFVIGSPYRIVIVLLSVTLLMWQAKAEPAPRVQQVSKEARTARNIYTGNETTALFAPAPVYPRHARLQRLEGNGVFGLLLKEDGNVGGVAVLRSTGIKELDVAAAQALILWKFPPPRKSGMKGVKVPVRFEMMSRFRGGTVLTP